MTRNVLLGVCGSIAAVKSQSICLALQHQECDVRVAMTHSAKQILTAAALSAVCRTAPFTDMWSAQNTHGGEIHIEWAAWADVIVIAPASASLLAALVHGFYDNCVSLLAANLNPNRWLIAPAMSQEMWMQPAVQNNVAALTDWGATFLGPVQGAVASGASGQRLMEPRALAEKTRLFLDALHS